MGLRHAMATQIMVSRREPTTIFRVSNQLLMTYHYNSRFVHHFSLVRGASVFSRWQSTQRPTIGEGAETKKLENVLQKKGTHRMYPLLQRFKGDCRRRGRKDTRTWGNGWPWVKYLLGTAAKLKIRTHNGCESIHKTCASWSQNQTPSGRRKLDTMLHP